MTLIYDSYLNNIPSNRTQRPLKNIFDQMAGTGGVLELKDASGNIFYKEGTTIPTAATAGYSAGAELRLTTPTLGQCPTWINQGSTTSCLFVPVGPVMGYGFAAAAGPIDSVTGSATQTLAQDFCVPSDIALVGYAVTDDHDQVAAAATTTAKSNITLTCSADPATAHDFVWAILRNKCTPAWDIFAAGTYTAVAGDDTTVAITVAGVTASDIAFAIVTDTDDTDTVDAVACTTNTVTITVSADPVTDHTWAYFVLRPRGTFAPSHYVAYAGVHTTVGGATAEAITVTGALATDIPFVMYHTTNDTDTLVKSVIAADTLTVTCSADPSTAHKLTYVVLRAY